MFAPNRRQERRMDVILTVENETGKTYDLLDYSDYELCGIFFSKEQAVLCWTDQQDSLRFTFATDR